MTFPPPPPDRMHLQHQPASPPPQQQAGPGGAYGPMQQRPDQPIPGQAPPPAMTMAKPGTITGIQVILWIFTALAGIGDIGSAIGLVNYFNPFSLIGLAFAVYSTVQALTSGIHITRGKRWAWIWSLVSAILGLAISAVAIVFGIVFIETGWVSLLVGIVLGGLYATLLGLLCSKSARQWILMHRIQRGEVQLPGAPGGFAQGAAPERPATRPGTATFAAVLAGLVLAVAAWTAFGSIRSLIALNNGGFGIEYVASSYGTGMILILAVAGVLTVVFAFITLLGVLRGSFGARVFTTVWTSVLVLPWGLIGVAQTMDYVRYSRYALPPDKTPWLIGVGRQDLTALLVIVLFIAVLTPSVRAWTPGKGGTALIVVVPQAQYGMPPQGQYGPPQQYPGPQQGPGGQPPQPYSPQPPYSG
ncbi:hypothetical protein [Glycomyces sp. NPDC047010]|uniref:hypothetical protein n=1 Tax=Glycomyces sp. NPDC047010 TaxID=3155023 RepID=UPI0033EA9140